MKKAIVIGGGFTGFTWAHLLAKRGWKVEILEKEQRVGGGIRTLYHNRHPYTHGPRNFIGISEKAYEFINTMLPQRPLKHHALTYSQSDDRFYSYPPHVDDLRDNPDAGKIQTEIASSASERIGAPRNFEEKWAKGIGETLYRRLIDGYTRKHWGVPTNTIIDEPTYSGAYANNYAELRTGTRQIRADGFVSYPINVTGWDDYFARIAAEDGIVVRTGAVITAYDLERKTLHLGGERLAGDLIVSSLSPDVISGGAYGPLPYAGRTMSFLVLPVERIFPDDIYFLYYAGDEPYLRVVEYKKLTGYKSPHTLLGFEYPAVGPKDYPYLIQSEINRARRYINDLPKGVVSMGRQGTYRYQCMSDIIDDALAGVEEY